MLLIILLSNKEKHEEVKSSPSVVEKLSLLEGEECHTKITTEYFENEELIPKDENCVAD